MAEPFSPLEPNKETALPTVKFESVQNDLLARSFSEPAMRVTSRATRTEGPPLKRSSATSPLAIAGNAEGYED